MKIAILSPWRQEKDYGARENDYLKRLPRDFRVEIEEIKGEKGEGRELLRREGERLLARVRKGSLLVVLTERGKTFDSPAFAQWLEGSALEGRGEITFVLGSAAGIDQALIDRADLALSLSPMTFPHHMARVMLIEQLYRAHTLIRGGPYHK